MYFTSPILVVKIQLKCSYSVWKDTNPQIHFRSTQNIFSGTQLRVHLDIQVGEHAIDYANVAQKEKLSELQLRVRQLLDQVEQITKEQNYQRYREERFRQTSESTNQRVLWWEAQYITVSTVSNFKCLGGLWLRQPSSSSWAPGKWDISRAFSRPRSWSRPLLLLIFECGAFNRCLFVGM